MGQNGEGGIFFVCAKHGGRADVGIKEQLKVDVRQTHVKGYSTMYCGYERGSLESDQK